MNARIFLLLSLLIVLVTGQAFAQSDGESVILLTATLQEAIGFQALNAAGDIIQFGQLPLKFRLINYQQVMTDDYWLIESTASIALSPDHRHVAFVAIAPSEQRLFVYGVTGEEIASMPIMRPVEIRWSPDSRSLAVANLIPDDRAPRAPIAYFDLETKQLSNIAADFGAQIPRRMSWLDDETLVFYAITPDNNRIALDMLSLDGTLTELFDSSMLPAYLEAWLCERAWSKVQQLFYVSVGCAQPQPTILEALYAVDLQSNASLLLEPPDELLNRDDPQDSFLIAGIELHEADTYAVTVSGDVNLADRERDNDWRILRFRDGQLNEVYAVSLAYAATLENPTISPDGRYLTVGIFDQSKPDDMESTLVVVDLQTGQRIREIDGAGRYGWSVAWLNHHSFVYTNNYNTVECQCPFPLLGSRTLLVDLSTTEMLDITDRLGEFTWLFVE